MPTAPNRRPSFSTPRNLPICRFRRVLNPDLTPPPESCSICLEDFQINSCSIVTVNELPCQHFFHRDCIAKWLARSNTCPMCRFELPIEFRRSEGRNQSGEQRVQLRLPPRVARPLRRVLTVQSLSASAASDEDRAVLTVNYGIRSGSGYDVMRDEDEGDELTGESSD